MLEAGWYTSVFGKVKPSFVTINLGAMMKTNKSSDKKGNKSPAKKDNKKVCMSPAKKTDNKSTSKPDKIKENVFQLEVKDDTQLLKDILLAVNQGDRIFSSE